MNHRTLFTSIACALIAIISAHAGSELEQLRALVAEQERQIRLLEEENAQLRADAAPRPSRSLHTGGTSLVSTTAQPASRPAAAGETYTVVPGDNLARIGRQLGVSAQALAKANGLEAGSIIHPGQKLRIPQSASTAPALPSPQTPAPPAPSRVSHTVSAGETFYSIARQHGIPVDRLMSANPDTPPAMLRVGQAIQVPQAGNNTASAASSAPAPVIESEPSPETQPAAQPSGNRRQIRTIMIDGEMSYGAFAAKHGTTPERLNQLNGLDLDARTILAKGSELYVPAQP